MFGPIKTNSVDAHQSFQPIMWPLANTEIMIMGGGAPKRSKGSFSPKSRSKGLLCSSGTDRHDFENKGHPFRVSVFFTFSFNLSSRSGPIQDLK